MNISESAKAAINGTISIKWGVSRGRDTAGYITCSLWENGRRLAACNGGGYDMRGTVVGHWVAGRFAAELRALKPEQMPAQSHWEREPARVCDGACKEAWRKAHMDFCLNEGKGQEPQQVKLPEDCYTCPTCGGETEHTRDGKTVDDGRKFHGLCFYDPHYDVMKAKLEHADGTFTTAEDIGKTYHELDKGGKVVALDILRQWYRETSPHATERHTVPTIDGACGFSEVCRILNAIGLGLRQVTDTSKLDVYLITEAA